MPLTVKDLRELINLKGLREDAIITDMQLQDFVHITHDTEGNIRLCTSRPIGRCNRTDEYVYPSVVEGYSAYCPELDEDLYDMEWTLEIEADSLEDCKKVLREEHGYNPFYFSANGHNFGAIK